jgi:predicted TIM-barrel fold metal-dependent hydrolase
MFPTLASVIEQRIDDYEVVNALMHSLNEWIFEEWGFGDDGRIFGVPVINLMNVDLAVKELELLLERGARTVLVRPAPVKDFSGSRSFGLEEFDPFWARINEAGIFVSLHSSDSGYDEFVRNWEGGYEMRPFESSGLKAVIDVKERAIFDSVAALICHGVFERHPKVKVAAVENGSSWVGPMVEKLRIAYGKVPQTFPRHPLETFREHFYVCPFYEDDFYELAEQIGVDHILFGSDYPHPEGLAEPLGYLDEIQNFGKDDQAKVMSTNLKTLLNA